MTTATFRADLFAGKVALVSGGTSGIGAGIGDAPARCGADVVVTGGTTAETAAARARDGFRCREAVVLDVRDGGAVALFVAGFARLDIVLNCAGVIRRGTEHDPTVFAEGLDRILNGTMRGVPPHDRGWRPRKGVS